MQDTDISASTNQSPRWQQWVRPTLIAAVAILLNVLAYYLIPPNFAHRLGAFGYLGVFIITFVANATVVVPVPYIGLIVRMAQIMDVGGVVLAGALGSAMGESVAFFVGRAGRETMNDTPLYRWVQRQMKHPWRAFAVLFMLAAPPNPAFDVAGLTAGAMGLPFWLFFCAVFLGRVIRIAIFAMGGAWFTGG
ncbi:MAG TPA: VTT domain-containing protein [Roseiflexaceae bacterium]|jgi:membrane protein YqaA with SNARE-associated domain|nr:VTT domain-containing protein [Roseiflexaceae bacterium]